MTLKIMTVIVVVIGLFAVAMTFRDIFWRVKREDVDMGEIKTVAYRRGERLGTLDRRIGEKNLSALNARPGMSDAEFDVFIQRLAVRHFKRIKSKIRTQLMMKRG